MEPKGSRCGPVATTMTHVIDNRATLEVPLDFSFMNITEITDLESETPREPTNGKKPRKNENELFNCKCLRLNNNSLREIKEITDVLGNVITQPTALTWIDISFNQIIKIDPVLCDFPTLQILYLHGNSIAELREVDKLGGCPNLKKLSLHGNPIEQNKSYRWYILAKVPQLHTFDMSGVTKADRATASTIGKIPLPKKKKKKEGE